MKQGGPLRRYTPLRARSPLRRRAPLTGAKSRPRQKTALRSRRRGKIAALEAECDRLWSEGVKARARYRSELSGEGGRLESAHIANRWRRSVRWDLMDGVCLTAAEHQYFTDNPQRFREWVRSWWPRTEMTLDELYAKSEQIARFTESDLTQVRDYLQEFIRAHA